MVMIGFCHLLTYFKILNKIYSAFEKKTISSLLFYERMVPVDLLMEERVKDEQHSKDRMTFQYHSRIKICLVIK